MQNRVRGMAGKTALFSHYFAWLESLRFPSCHFTFINFRWLLVYSIDTMPPDSALRPHFGKGFEPSFIGSITYNVRFHNNFRADEWMLLEIENEISG